MSGQGEPAPKPPTAEELLAAAEQTRRERKAKLRELFAEQRTKDLEALAAVEAEHGDSRVKAVDIPHSPGLPTLIAVRCPTDPEIKRYRFRLKPDKDGTPGDAIGAADEVADNCVVYPPVDSELYKRIRAERPGVHAQCGAAAVSLAVGKTAEEGKG